MSSRSGLPVLTIAGLCETIEEVRVKVKNADRPVCHIQSDDVHKVIVAGLHSVLRVSLKTGEQYAIDITAAQYGWARNSQPWKQFAHRYIFEQCSTNKLGYTVEEINEQMTKWGTKDFRTKKKCAALAAFQGLHLRVQDWMRKNDLNPVELLKLPAQEFESKVVDLIKTTKTGFASSVALLRKSHLYRYY